MRICPGYVYKFYEIDKQGREHYLTGSFGQDLELFELSYSSDGKEQRKRRNVAEMELRELEGKGNFSVMGHSDIYHQWCMQPVIFQSLSEKNFLLLSQHLEDLVRIVIVRRHPA